MTVNLFLVIRPTKDITQKIWLRTELRRKPTTLPWLSQFNFKCPLSYKTIDMHKRGRGNLVWQRAKTDNWFHTFGCSCSWPAECTDRHALVKEMCEGESWRDLHIWVQSYYKSQQNFLGKKKIWLNHQARKSTRKTIFQVSKQSDFPIQYAPEAGKQSGSA